MLSQPRALLPQEQGAALSLWQEVFQTPPGYFERYFQADPNYLPGDTLGIWDGVDLVSAVHVCRRPVLWEGGILLCGGVANVATQEPYRRQGLSRRLLALLTTKMEQEGFGYSLLGTGTPTHYSALGWELTRRPQITLTLSSSEVHSRITWNKLAETSRLRAAYARSPRPLQFERLPDYFEGWVGWDWRRLSAQIGLTSTGDYLVLGAAEAPDHPLSVLEWRAGSETAELNLLQAAAVQAQENGLPGLWLDCLPQYVSANALRSISEVSRSVEGDGMIRNISLPTEEYARVARAYSSGQAAWWPGDGF